ncbi:MAG: hypothetical protein HY663_02065 [Chloroflexi bacterium]|nr:hypothetical protein [Chloroflexota bacterium]
MGNKAKGLMLVLSLIFVLGCTPSVRPSPSSPSDVPAPGALPEPVPRIVLPPPTLTIITPAERSTVPFGSVNITVAVGNFTLTLPGGTNMDGKGHIHYYLDVAVPTTPGHVAVTSTGSYQATDETQATWKDVLPGTHTLGVQLVNSDHTPLNPPVVATVNITVVSGILRVAGHLNIAAGPGHITDLWAHTARNGRSYAYLGSFDEPFCAENITGVHIVDITEPTKLQEVGFISSPIGYRVNDVAVQRIKTPWFEGDILVHATEICRDSPPESQGKGIFLYDVTDPLNPQLLAGNFLNFEVHNVFIYQQDDRAFVIVVRDDAERDFYILEITNPKAPQEVAVRGGVDWFNPETDQLALGELPAAFLHDVWVTVYPKDFPDVALAGKVLAYLAYWDAGLVILDITDPANPIFLGDSDYLVPDPISKQAPEGNSHDVAPTADGKLVFMGDEDFSPTHLSFNITEGGFAGEYRAASGVFTIPIASLPDKIMKGPTTFVGLADNVLSIPLPNMTGLETGEKPIALIERGDVPFDTKIANVAQAGYGGAVIFNVVDTPGRIVSMNGDPAKGTIPAVFVSRFTALAVLGISPNATATTPLPPPGTAGSRIAATTVFDGWGYGRILDVSNPANIREVGQFATKGTFAQPIPPGDHSMHDAVLEGRRAYISWYADGIRVVDFSQPEKPTEIAYFVDTEKGSNFWGVYLFKHPNGQSYILGSDRDTGLWILNIPGAGTDLPPGLP